MARQAAKPFVFALADCVTCTEHGTAIQLRRGDVWAADDPFVVFKSDMFSAEPPYMRRTDVAVSA
jgi:hypothetical protein